MLKGSGHSSLFFEGSEHEAGADSQSLPPLAHKVLKHFTGLRSTSRVRIEHRRGRRADGPSLKDRATKNSACRLPRMNVLSSHVIVAIL
jgi:hypothetical protein